MFYVEEYRLSRLLAELGDTKEQVLRKLREEGCRGKVGSPTTCPVAQYLTRHFAGVLVSADDVRLYRGKDIVRVQMPRPVEDFIRCFDNEWYSDLEQE